jgi:hypothetical protein
VLPSQGDRITAIDDRVYCGVVDKGDDGLAPGYFRWHPFGDGSGTNRAYREDTEGLSWIRGWHGDGSEELNALLAANKLQASSGGPFMKFDLNTATAALRGRSFPVVDGAAVGLPATPSPDDQFYLTIG